VFLVNFAADRTPAVALAHHLRNAGARAARDCIQRPLEESVAHAREQRFRWVAVLTAQGTAAPLRLLDLTAGSETPVDHDQLVRHIITEES
jgi:histidyl-tRNA synthetase